MRLLVLGGTVFLGQEVARQAVAAGHQVTCVARGRSGEPPAGARFVAVDRETDPGLSALAGESFDAVIDVARRPSQVRSAVTALAGRVPHWVFVSTGSVYAHPATAGQPPESAALLPPAPPGEDLDDTTGAEAYGRNKVACEQAVIVGVGAERSAICRAGLIVGPRDPYGRFEYWVRRLARGGEVLAPGQPSDSVQLIDVRDLAAWLVDVAAFRHTGVYNATGAPVPRAEFLADVARGVGAEPAITWVDQEFLLGQGVQPWMGERSLPVWLPLPEYAGFLARDVRSAVATGLRTRPLAETARDTLRWIGDRPWTLGDRCGLAEDDEASLLAQWHARPR